MWRSPAFRSLMPGRGAAAGVPRRSAQRFPSRTPGCPGASTGVRPPRAGGCLRGDPAGRGRTGRGRGSTRCCSPGSAGAPSATLTVDRRRDRPRARHCRRRRPGYRIVCCNRIGPGMRDLVDRWGDCAARACRRRPLALTLRVGDLVDRHRRRSRHCRASALWRAVTDRGILYAPRRNRLRRLRSGCWSHSALLHWSSASSSIPSRPERWRFLGVLVCGAVGHPAQRPLLQTEGQRREREAAERKQAEQDRKRAAARAAVAERKRVDSLTKAASRWWTRPRRSSARSRQLKPRAPAGWGTRGSRLLPGHLDDLRRAAAGPAHRKLVESTRSSRSRVLMTPPCCVTRRRA